MAVMAESYRKPFAVYLVVSEYTVPSDDKVLIPRDDSDDKVLIPRNRVPLIPIPVKPKPTLDGVNKKH